MIKTYQDKKNTDPSLPTRETTPGIVRVQCPCGSWRPAFTLVDLRHVPTAPQKWACDGCRSTWERELTSIDGGGKITDIKEWRTRFIAAASVIIRAV